MLDPQRISLGKIRCAYNLNQFETEDLVKELWGKGVFPWDIWERAYKAYWLAVALTCRDHFKLPYTPYPEQPPAKSMWDTPNRWKNLMCGFFGELCYALPFNDIRDGIEYIVAETYEIPEQNFVDERSSFYAYLEEAEDDFNWDITFPINSDKLETMLNDKAFSPSQKTWFFIGKMFPDTMMIDKAAARCYLEYCEIPLCHEVKGLTKRKMISFSGQDRPAESGKNGIRVPVSLWQGKTKEFICAEMRKVGFANEVIAHVLLCKRGIKISKREIAALLADTPKSDATLDKIGKNLVQKAAEISIKDVQGS